MGALGRERLHTRFIDALGNDLASHGPLDEVPLLIDIRAMVPLAVWTFTLTNPPGGRHPAESKIQVMVPGQGRSERGNFDGPSGRFKILVGVHSDEDLFVLWDAYKHRDFAFSKNVQVRGPWLWDAQVAGLATGSRKLKSGVETVFAARSDHLRIAIERRIESE